MRKFIVVVCVMLVICACSEVRSIGSDVDTYVEMVNRPPYEEEEYVPEDGAPYLVSGVDTEPLGYKYGKYMMYQEDTGGYEYKLSINGHPFYFTPKDVERGLNGVVTFYFGDANFVIISSSGAEIFLNDKLVEASSDYILQYCSLFYK